MSRYKTTELKNGKKTCTHRLVWEQFHQQKIPPGYEVHHIDGNGKNNDPTNLVLLTISEHRALHAKLRKEGNDVVDRSNPDVIAAHEQQKKWRLANKDHTRETHAKHYAAHRDERRAYAKKYRAEHAEERKAYTKQYRITHIDAIMEYNRTHRAQQQAWRDAHREEAKAYRQANKDTIRMMHTKYREANRPIVNALYNLNHAKKRG
ncbi:MAG: HNH endonuclease, partial [Paludibacteraceae bacterium]|nr:HNH endonuclease [Paludibacteraceae bacterium]